MLFSTVTHSQSVSQKKKKKTAVDTTYGMRPAPLAHALPFALRDPLVKSAGAEVRAVHSRGC